MKITLTAPLDSPQATCIVQITADGVLRWSAALNAFRAGKYDEDKWTRYFHHLTFVNEVIPLMPSLQARGYFIDKTK